MPERGYLVIADITGYTHFLTGSELEHAQGVLEDLYEVILAQLTSPLRLSNIQGDAFFAYAGDDAVLAPGQIMDALEALYFGFRDQLTSIVDNTSCPCRACSNARDLDLKFVVHHGEYMTQDIANRRELTGSDVILLHRLLKNDVPGQTGISSYGLLTSAAVAALDLAELRDATISYVTEIEEFGKVECSVIDFGARWLDYHAANVIVVDDDELWFEPVSRVMPASIQTVWESFCNAELQAQWNKAVQSYERVTGDPARLKAGAVDHCAHGKENLIMHHVDVRPLDHLTTEMAIPMQGRARWTTQFAAENGSTRVTIRAARPVAPGAARTLVLRIISALLVKKKALRQFVEELKLFEAFLSENRQQDDFDAVAPRTLSPDEIRDAARASVSGAREKPEASPH